MVDEIKSWVKKDLIIKEGYNQLQEILLDRAIDLTRNKTAKEIFKELIDKKVIDEKLFYPGLHQLKKEFGVEG